MNTLKDFDKLSKLIFDIASLDLGEYGCNTGSPIKPPKTKIDIELQSLSRYNPLERLALVAASSKPLPPSDFPLTIAGVLINELQEATKIARFLPEKQANEVMNNASSFALTTINDCGTNSKEQTMAKIFKRLKGKIPPIDPNPQPWLKDRYSHSEIFTIGAAVLNYTSTMPIASFDLLNNKLQATVKNSINQI